MSEALSHMLVVPIVLPLLTTAGLLLIATTRRRFKARVNIISTLVGLIVAATILWHVDRSGKIEVYLASNWEAPFGIVLVADRLSALMLVLTGVVSSCVALYAEAAWSRAGVYFHALFQLQIMGLNGAFLTGDFFNLFVFFEVMLAASYGLQLHGSGWPRVRSGLHYIAVNLLASSLFLVGVAVLYGVAGTLSMADLGARIAHVPASERGLLHTGAAILAMAFLIKAAIWPLNSWLVPAYTAASAPVAALFALMTKVGIYALLRSWTLLFSDGAGPSLNFGRPVLSYGGFATIAFGALGLMASMRLGRIASFAIIVSSGTLLAALGAGAAPVTSAALFYMLSATLAVSALFLLVEVIERIGVKGRELPDDDDAPGTDTNLDDQELPLVGRVFPMSITVLGLSFMTCAVIVAGLPPLSGFIAKVSLMKAVISVEGAHADGSLSGAGWMMIALLLISGLAFTMSLSKAGIRHFWSIGSRFTSQLEWVEAVAVLALLVSCFLLTVWAEPVMRYTNATAAVLHAPAAYIEAVSSKKARPGPTPSKRELENAP